MLKCGEGSWELQLEDAGLVSSVLRGLNSTNGAWTRTSAWSEGKSVIGLLQLSTVAVSTGGLSLTSLCGARVGRCSFSVLCLKTVENADFSFIPICICFCFQVVHAGPFLRPTLRT